MIKILVLILVCCPQLHKKEEFHFGYGGIQENIERVNAPRT